MPDYPATASDESTVYDAGRDCDWGNISWEEDVPSGTGISFQVAVASDLEGPYNYVGPNGTSGTFFSAAAGEALPSLNGRYCRYKAYFTSTGSDTAAFGNVQISYVGDLDSQIVVTEYDGAGNITKRTTTDDNGSAEDVRAINNLNQVNTRDVGGDTWTYAYNLDGTTADWDNGIDTWTLTWDPAGLQHLERVQGPGSVDVAYTLDDQGRLLTRASGGDTTVFQWDGWDCIGETTGMLTTRWYAPQGQLLSFDRGGETYAVVSDALGSVRLVVDDTGTVICSFSYGAWGEVLPGSFDNLPGGMPYRFVGSLGVRFDSATGLHYMRARWYDPTLQRFVSRDPIGLAGGVNLYRYARNQPTKEIDPYGLYVDYDRQGQTITLTIPIAFCNDGLSAKDFADAISKFSQDIIRVWGGSHDGYDVKIVIIPTFEDCLCTDKDRLDRARKDKRINHIRLIKGTGRSETARGIGNSGDWYAGNPPVTGSHEGGHVLGVKDNYPYDDPYAPPPSGYEDDIMSNFWKLYNQGVLPVAAPGRIQSIVDYWESRDVQEQIRSWPSR